MKENVRLG